MSLRTTLVTSAVMLAFAGAARPDANIVVNHSFEDSSFTNGWIPSSIDALGNYVISQDGNQCVDLCGGSPGSISQTLNTTPGQFYSLDFYMAGNLYAGTRFRQLDVMWNGALAGTFTYDGTGESITAPRWDFHSIAALQAVGATTELAFVESSGLQNDAGAYGAAIDNVRVMAVPAPASCLILSLGAGSLTRRRRR